MAEIKQGMEDQTSGNIARDGAAKRTQTEFPVRVGMKDMTELSGVGPDNPGSGPDAGSPNPLAPTTPDKDIQTEFPAAWDMTDADGDGPDDDDIGGAVLDEAVISGSHLPAA